MWDSIAKKLKNIPVTNGYIKHPRMVFPMPDLKSQIFAMYQRPGFEQNMTKWIHRHVDENILANIYDGKIWKLSHQVILKTAHSLLLRRQIHTLEL